jgi:hypothetical protein
MSDVQEVDIKSIYRLVELNDKITKRLAAMQEEFDKATAHLVQQQGIIFKQLDIYLTTMANGRLKPEVKVDGIGVCRLKYSNKVTVKSRAKLLDELTGLYSQKGNEAFDYVTLTPKPKECVIETLDKRTGLILVEAKLGGLEVKRAKKVTITKK